MLAATEIVISTPPLDRERGKDETTFDIFYCVIYILSDNCIIRDSIEYLNSIQYLKHSFRV